jgi:hypothetical protein
MNSEERIALWLFMLPILGVGPGFRPFWGFLKTVKWFYRVDQIDAVFEAALVWIIGKWEDDGYPPDV